MLNLMVFFWHEFIISKSFNSIICNKIKRNIYNGCSKLEEVSFDIPHSIIIEFQLDGLALMNTHHLCKFYFLYLLKKNGENLKLTDSSFEKLYSLSIIGNYCFASCL